MIGVSSILMLLKNLSLQDGLANGTKLRLLDYQNTSEERFCFIKLITNIHDLRWYSDGDHGQTIKVEILSGPKFEKPSTFKFDCGEDPGFEVDDNMKVKKVTNESQSERYNMKVGWKLLEINGRDADPKLLDYVQNEDKPSEFITHNFSSKILNIQWTVISNILNVRLWYFLKFEVFHQIMTFCKF